jgi:hypothetical protein
MGIYGDLSKDGSLTKLISTLSPDQRQSFLPVDDN